MIYRGYAEASKVPAEWHGWLHYTFDEPPTVEPLMRRGWEKDHLPNLTGTVEAWRPRGVRGTANAGTPWATIRPGGRNRGFIVARGQELAETSMGAVVLVAAGVFFAYALSAGGKSMSGSGYEVSARFGQVGALEPGADIRVAGVKVGTVSSIALDPKTFLAVARFNLDSSVKLPSRLYRQDHFGRPARRRACGDRAGRRAGQSQARR